jgi:hypothetical protein
MQKEETTRYVEILPHLAQEMIRLRVVRELTHLSYKRKKMELLLDDNDKEEEEEEEMIVGFIEATLAAPEEEEEDEDEDEDEEENEFSRMKHVLGSHHEASGRSGKNIQSASSE